MGRDGVKAGLPAEVPLSGTEAGQTFIEILLAFSIAMLVLSAIVVGVNSSLSNTQYTKNQNLANSYAQEGMAVVRKVKDSGWNNFFVNMSQPMYCIDQGSSTTSAVLSPSGCGNNVNIFSREVKLERANNSCIADTNCINPLFCSKLVTVRVSWSDSKCPISTPNCHKTELISCFSNLGGKQTP